MLHRTCQKIISSVPCIKCPEIVTFGFGLIVGLYVLCLFAFISYRCVRSMENASVLTAAVAKVLTAPSALGKAPPLALQDVTLQGHRWRDTFHAPPFFSFSTSLIYCTVSSVANPDKVTSFWFGINSEFFLQALDNNP